MAKPRFYPVILAGGRGTRFWPRSRKKLAKQVLALDGEQTMIQQTVARLAPLAPAERFWVITNGDLSGVIARQLRTVPRQQIVAEPAQRNTAPAIGLAAFILEREDPRAVIGMFDIHARPYVQKNVLTFAAPMNKFRRMGFIEYSRTGLSVHPTLLKVLLHD